jgi:hypothetical protein
MVTPPPDASAFTYVALTGDQLDIVRLLVFAVVVGAAMIVFGVGLTAGMVMRR